MDNAGVFTLAVLQMTAARPLSLLTPITELDGMSSCSLEANFQYGSGGTTCSLIAATSFDGILWRHVARFDFTTATAAKLANIQASAAKGITAYVDLAAEGVNDGLLGNFLAAFVISTGAYANTVASLRASVR